VNPGARFHRLAQRELIEAARYYDSGSVGLGAVFLDEVERTIRKILEHPELGMVMQGAVRRRMVWRFPYSLLYSVTPSGIRILAVMHQRRRPSYWVGRE
jgi:toxin ParE1/3/4